jgi:hypothetical protein
MRLSRVRLSLLASSSFSALLLGSSPAFACYTGSFSGGYTSSGTTACITVSNTSFSGTLGNSGTISLGPTGIAVVNNSTINGGISDSGTISATNHGILIDHSSKVTSTGTAILINGPTFTGGIANSGTVSGGVFGIVVNSNVSQFGSGKAGGISNSGMISGGSTGIYISGVSTFSGGITNSGTISGGSKAIYVNAVSNFSGGIGNSGAILAGSNNGILLQGVSAFSGGITNSGTISAGYVGIYLLNASTFSGGIGNSGTISAGTTGVHVGRLSTFSGGIVNSGTITASKDDIIVVNVSTFSGGISNSGTLSGGYGMVLGNGVSTFAGGMANSGVILATHTGIYLYGGSTFAGGISNSGTISAAKFGIYAYGVSTFLGGISNSGLISSAYVGIDVYNAISSFSGGISNSGTISALYYGIVADTSTFTGGITNSGTIWAGNNDGILAYAVSTFSGGISNSGSISAAYSAIYVAGVSAFSGGISNSGTLSGRVGIIAQNDTIFAGGITNSGNISVANNGISLLNDVSFAGGISNSGAISGATAILLKQVSTFSGGITNSGTISGAVGILVQNSGPVSIFDSGSIIGTGGTAVSFTGTTSGNNTFTLGPGYSITGNVIGAGTDTFQLGGSGNGSFNLSTIGTQYTGFTTFNVVSGIWDATGTFSAPQAWNVNGGTLAGSGTFASVNVNSGGTLAPGTPGVAGGIMTIDGNLAFQSGATYLVTINGTTASRANVTGSVTLNGALDVVLLPGSYSAKTVYDILDPASVSGQFTSISLVNTPGMSGNLSYAASGAFLNLTANLGGGGGLGVNQQNVATTINTYFNGGGPLPAGFFPLFELTGADLGHGLGQLSGEAATGAQKGVFQLTNDFLDLMLDPTAGGGGGISGGANAFAPERDTSLPGEVALAYARALKAPPSIPSPSSGLANFDQRWTAWGAAFGGSSFTGGNAATGSNNVTASDYGFAAGMDYHASPDVTYGFGLAGGGTNWTLAQGLGSGRSDSFQAGVYAKTHAGPAYFSAALAFANHWFTTDRTAMGDQLHASFMGQSYAARLEAGYRYAVPITGAIVGVTPYAALQTQDFQTPGYSETDLTGGGFGLSYASMNATDTRSEIGARFDTLQVVSGMPLVLRGRLAWAHDWVTNPSLGAVFEALPGANFTVNGAAAPKDSVLTTAAAELHLSANWTAIAKFDGEFGASSQTYAGTGTLRYSW